jgi:hypothetical protein
VALVRTFSGRNPCSGAMNGGAFVPLRTPSQESGRHDLNLRPPGPQPCDASQAYQRALASRAESSSFLSSSADNRAAASVCGTWWT